MKDLKGCSVLVVGLARSGVAAAHFLSRRGAQVTVTDIKSKEELADRVAALPPSVHLRLGGHFSEDLRRVELVVVSPGVSAQSPFLEEARRAGIPVVGEIELAFPFLKGTIIAVTGSNGKTTTTTLLGQLFQDQGRQAVVAGNVGIPLTSVVDQLRDDSFLALEISSFQLETIRNFRPHLALILNITPDHLDRHPSFEAYVEAKRRIFMNQSPADWAVLNADDPLLRRMNPPGRTFFFSSSQPLPEGAFLEGERLILQRDGRRCLLLRRCDIPLKGIHNVENVLAASAAGFLCGLDPEGMGESVRRFRGVEHRLEYVATIAGVDFYNDSKATNVDSARHALQSFQQPLVVIMGGKDKGSRFEALTPLVAERVKRLILIGSARHRIAEALAGTAEAEMAATLPEAVQAAFAAARPGDVVLLAPACASFDMFQNYEERGEAFKAAVRSLQARQASRPRQEDGV